MLVTRVRLPACASFLPSLCFRTQGKLLVALAMSVSKSPATRNRTRDHLIAAAFYSQMLYQLSYSRLAQVNFCLHLDLSASRAANTGPGNAITQPQAQH